MLDHIVAGGQHTGLGLISFLKECTEEVGMPEEITPKGIQTVGAISYEVFEKVTDSGEIDGCISRYVLFCYDLELPLHFVPNAVGGEV